LDDTVAVLIYTSLSLSSDLQFLEVPDFRNVTLRCLSEIGGLSVGPEYNQKFVILFQMVMTSVNKMIPPSTSPSLPPLLFSFFPFSLSPRLYKITKLIVLVCSDIAGAYAESQNQDQELVLNLALFLTNFLREHLKLVENDQNKELLLNAHLYLVKISQVEEREVFKICLEYWAKLVAELYEEIQSVRLDARNLLIWWNM
jgi:exportin-1